MCVRQNERRQGGRSRGDCRERKSLRRFHAAQKRNPLPAVPLSNGPRKRSAPPKPRLPPAATVQGHFPTRLATTPVPMSATICSVDRNTHETDVRNPRNDGTDSAERDQQAGRCAHAGRRDVPCALARASAKRKLTQIQIANTRVSEEPHQRTGESVHMASLSDSFFITHNLRAVTPEVVGQSPRRLGPIDARMCAIPARLNFAT